MTANDKISIEEMKRAADYFNRLADSEVKEGIVVGDDGMVALALKAASYLERDRDTICREVKKVVSLTPAVEHGDSSKDVMDMCREYARGNKSFRKYVIMQAARCCSAMLEYAKILEGKSR